MLVLKDGKIKLYCCLHFVCKIRLKVGPLKVGTFGPTKMFKKQPL